MATKFSGFTAGSTITGSDILVGLQGGVNVKWTFTQLASFTGLTVGATTITSGTTLRFLYDAAGVLGETNGLTWDATNKCITLGGATVTTSNPVITATQTWNAGAVTFAALQLTVTDSASATASNFSDFLIDSSSRFRVRKDGAIYSNDPPTGDWIVGKVNQAIQFGGTSAGSSHAQLGTNELRLRSGSAFQWSSSGSNAATSADTGVSRISAGFVGVGTGAQGAVDAGIQALYSWTGAPSTALTTLTGASDGFRGAAANVTALASENTTASSSTQGAFVGMYSNDGAAMASGDRLGGIRMGGSSSASALRNSVVIAGFADQTWVDASAYGSRIDFQTTTNGATTPSTKASLGNDGVMTLAAATATPAGGSTAARLLLGTTAGFGIYYGSGAPSSLTAGQGSFYLRSDGTGAADRAYINSSAGSGTTWTAVATAG